MLIKCAWCGLEFDKQPNKIRACLGKANGLRSKKDHTMVCDNCGCSFQGNKKHSHRNKHFFCCAECSYEYKTKKVEVECDLCGKKFFKKRSDIARTKHNFCSQNCNRDFLFLMGENIPNRKINGRVRYRAIAEHIIGRKLQPTEEVHHLDGDHSNHNADNLSVMSASEHSKIHASQKARDARGRFIKG